jgi:hypothetical protein
MRSPACTTGSATVVGAKQPHASANLGAAATLDAIAAAMTLLFHAIGFEILLGRGRSPRSVPMISIRAATASARANHDTFVSV